MRVEQVMSTNVKRAKESDTADAAYEIMRQQGIHHLVVTAGPDVVGVVSERDLGGRKGASLRKGRTVGEVMTPSVVSVSPGDTIRKVANLMRGRNVGCLPVLMGGKVKGIVTVTDLLELLGRGTEKPVRRTERPTINRKHGKRK